MAYAPLGSVEAQTEDAQASGRIRIVSVALMPFPVAHGGPARLSPPPLSSKLPGSTAAPGP